jgi:hypothetical protein
MTEYGGYRTVFEAQQNQEIVTEERGNSEYFVLCLYYSAVSTQ